MKSMWKLIVVAGLVLVSTASSAWAAPPPGPYFNGFETNTAGWFNFGGGTLTRQPSGYSTGAGGYANGITSASGGYHARLNKDPSPDSCTFGGGTAPIYSGPYTNWGGYSSIFPTGGYTTRLDIYLDTVWATTHADQRFDWSSAVSSATGGHRRDFVFNAATNSLGFVISGSTNATRCGANPATGMTPTQVSVSGWYTFEHVFSGVSGGPLVVTMRLINKATSAVVGTWVQSVPADTIGSVVGGNRYGWFVQNEIDQLAIDNSERTGIVSTPACEIKFNDGGRITALNGDVATFGGNAKVSSSGDASGQQEYQDHGPIQPLRFKASTIDGVVCSDDRTEATIAGTGTVDGSGEHEYYIKIRDGDDAEPTTEDTYEILIPAVGYYSGDRPLEGGNIQIH